MNLAHLQVGTHQENMNDMTGAGRGRSQLTNKEVVEIRGLSSFLQWDVEKIADEFGVPPSYVRMILREQRRTEAEEYELEREAREQQRQTVPSPRTGPRTRPAIQE